MDLKDLYFMFSIQVLRYFLWYRVWVHADSMLLSAGPGHWLLGMQILMGYYYVEIGYTVQLIVHSYSTTGYRVSRNI